MTTIIGIQKEDSCEIWCDSLVSHKMGTYESHPDMKKIVKNGAFLVAGSGEVAPNDIMAHVWKPPKPTVADKKDLYHFMLSKVIPSLRQCLIDNGHNFETSGEDGEPRFLVLLAVNGELFELGDDLSVVRNIIGIYGIGSGANYARGAIAVGATPEDAMDAVTKFNLFSAPPFYVETQYKS